MLIDNINKEFKKLEKENKDKNMSDKAGMDFKGELEIWAYKKGELIHHDKGHNIITKWAKHATMNMLTSESFSTHGDRILASGATSYTKRSENSGDHNLTTNNDGTMISNGQYLADNTDYYDSLGSSGTPQYKYKTLPSIDLVSDITKGDYTNGDYTLFKYPYFPTKMLFGTGIEFDSWGSIPAANNGTDQAGYGNNGNGSWDESSFNLYLTDSPIISNYYSAQWDGGSYILTPTRTVNDVYAASLSTTLTDDAFGVKGAIKDGTYTGQNQAVIEEIDGKWFSSGSYRGIGRPSFIYAKRNDRNMSSGSEAYLELGETVGTTDLNSKITYTVIMPEQTNGEFYPYNGYTLKVAGLFADAAMVLNNTVPIDNSENDDSLSSNLEYTNYMQQTGGIMWATRNIAPIFKSHDTKIIAQWTIYL